MDHWSYKAPHPQVKVADRNTNTVLITGSNVEHFFWDERLMQITRNYCIRFLKL